MTDAVDSAGDMVRHAHAQGRGTPRATRGSTTQGSVTTALRTIPLRMTAWCRLQNDAQSTTFTLTEGACHEDRHHG